MHQKTDIFIELHVPDFKRAVGFYRILGFDVVWMDEEYLVMRRRDSILNFYKGSAEVYNHSYFYQFPKNTKRGYAVEIALFVDNIDAFYQSVKDQVNVVAPLKLKKWGAKDFRIEDPFGFYIRISESHDWIHDQEKIDATPDQLKKRELFDNQL